MRLRIRPAGVLGTAAVLLAAGPLSLRLMAPLHAADAPAADDTAKQAQTILKNNCGGCHSGAHPRKGIDVTSRDNLVNIKKVVKPNDADGSELIDAVVKGRMPPKKMLSDDDIAALKKWVNAGAPDWAPPAQ